MGHGTQRAQARNPVFTPGLCAVLVELVAGGARVRDAARLLGVSEKGAYKAKARDPEFAAAWAWALEMSAENIEARLRQAGANGADIRMPETRAAEVILRARSRRYRPGGDVLQAKVGLPGVD